MSDEHVEATPDPPAGGSRRSGLPLPPGFPKEEELTDEALRAAWRTVLDPTSGGEPLRRARLVLLSFAWYRCQGAIAKLLASNRHTEWGTHLDARGEQGLILDYALRALELKRTRAATSREEQSHGLLASGNGKSVRNTQAWLRTSLVNLVRDVLRAERTQLNVSAPEVPLEPTREGGPSPADVTAFRDWQAEGRPGPGEEKDEASGLRELQQCWERLLEAAERSGKAYRRPVLEYLWRKAEAQSRTERDGIVHDFVTSLLRQESGDPEDADARKKIGQRVRKWEERTREWVLAELERWSKDPVGSGCVAILRALLEHLKHQKSR